MWIPNMPTVILTGFAATAGAVCIYKDVRGGPRFNRSIRADDKVIVITGANSGIGREAAWEFANRGAKVFMACRDMQKCEKERRTIVSETGNKYVYCRPCDLASLESIRQFVQRFKSEEPYLDVLVNNAGVMHCPREVTNDGFERHLGVNYLGHFLLTTLLLDTIKKSAPSRIILVSSDDHRRGTINKEDLNLEKKYEPAVAYNQSKLADALFARELGRRLIDSKVTVVAVDPGATDTKIVRHMPMYNSITYYFIHPFFWPFLKRPRVGAQTILHAALDPSIEKTTGDYYVDMAKVAPSTEAQDFELAQWLWKVSEKWTKLDEHKAALNQSVKENAA